MDIVTDTPHGKATILRLSRVSPQTARELSFAHLPDPSAGSGMRARLLQLARYGPAANVTITVKDCGESCFMVIVAPKDLRS